jgi:hypothetical protein
MPAMAEKTMAGMPFGKTTGMANGNRPSFRARLPPMPQTRMMAPTARWRGSNRLTRSDWMSATPCIPMTPKR